MKVLDFSKARVLVVGDVMLDQYWSGETSRISPEAPVPVVRVAEVLDRAGGAANVAVNAAALGASVGLIGVIGQDAAGDCLKQLVQRRGVRAHWVLSTHANTIRKLRILSRHQQLIRIDFEHPLPTAVDNEVLSTVAHQLPDYDVLVLSDYAKGTLAAVQDIIALANQLNKPVLVDPKGKNFQRYVGATLIKPNLSEFMAIVGKVDTDLDIEQAGTALMHRLSLEALLVTRSEAGMTLLVNGHKAVHIPTKAQEVYDVTGAGDTAMATLAVAYACGLGWQSAVRLANEAAGIAVRKLGTSTVSVQELNAALHPLEHQGAIATDVATLSAWVRTAQNAGERVVMTNGCFDILHPGHIRYLRQAKELGDRLIVAVNSDASVRRLKGDQRPINSLSDRMEMLAALDSVDWVIAFDEDTPRDLICQIRPDILVKGGDYSPEHIAGADCVLAYGGQVRILTYWEGHSTTSIIDKLGPKAHS